MVLVAYTVALPSPEVDGNGEAEVDGSFECIPQGERPTLRDVKAGWPFQGAYVFRGRVVPKNEPTAWVWFDLVDDGDTLQVTDGVVFVRAIPETRVTGQVSAPLDEEPLPLATYARWAAGRREEPLSLEQFPLSAVTVSAGGGWSRMFGTTPAPAPVTPTPTPTPTPGAPATPSDAPTGSGEEGSFWNDGSGGGGGDGGADPGQREREGEGGSGEGGGPDEDGQYNDDGTPQRHSAGGTSEGVVIDLDEQVVAAAVAARDKAGALASKAGAALSSLFGKATKAVGKAAERAQQARAGSAAAPQEGQAFPF